jgi:hypothetical protein
MLIVKGLYGLKQAGREWYLTFTTWLVSSHGMRRSMYLLERTS